MSWEGIAMALEFSLPWKSLRVVYDGQLPGVEILGISSAGVGKSVIMLSMVSLFMVFRSWLCG